jgi:hypothetical protein
VLRSVAPSVDNVSVRTTSSALPQLLGLRPQRIYNLSLAREARGTFSTYDSGQAAPPFWPSSIVVGSALQQVKSAIRDAQTGGVLRLHVPRGARGISPRASHRTGLDTFFFRRPRGAPCAIDAPLGKGQWSVLAPLTFPLGASLQWRRPGFWLGARSALIIHGIEAWNQRYWPYGLMLKSVDSFVAVSRYSRCTPANAHQHEQRRRTS